MRVALTVICLFGLALGGVREGLEGLTDADTAMVNNMMDVLDSGLNTEAGVDEKARALFISLTLTSTMTDLVTETLIETVTKSCVVNAAGGTSFTECSRSNRKAPSTSSISEAPITSTTSDSSESTTSDSSTSTTSDSSTSTTSAPASRRSIDLLVDHINKASVENEEHISEVSDFTEELDGESVTVFRDLNGERKEVSISEIMPSKVKRNELDVDFVVNADEAELQSGSMSWSEASVDKAHSACGRSGLKGDKKRARILALANEVVTKSLTLTETELVTAADTVTFTIGIACTAAGFMFQHPMCS